MTILDLTNLLPAERRLLDAAIAGEPCDLIDPDVEPTHDEIVQWNNPDREIRADFFADLITNRIPDRIVEKVEVRGAIVAGHVIVTGTVTVLPLTSRYCRYDAVTITRGVTFNGDAVFSGATFGKNAVFDGATFTGDAVFSGATFTGDAVFSGATFGKNAVFSRATFDESAEFIEATFGPDPADDDEAYGNAHFGGAKFSQFATFREGRFNHYAEFDRSTFDAEVNFDEVVFANFATFNLVTFGGNVEFGGAEFDWSTFHKVTFRGDVWFGEATFNEHAEFCDASFMGSAVFVAATFGGGVLFDRAEFTEQSSLSLNRAVGDIVSFKRARFAGSVDGAWATQTTTFDEARFVEPVVIRVLCWKLGLARTELRSGGTLNIHGNIDATATTFGARTTISDPGISDWVDWLPGPHERTVYGKAVPLKRRKRRAELLLPLLGISTSVLSLQRATVADLELSAVDLTDCLFEGAHGLNEMRMDSACRLPTTPEDIRFRRPVKFTDREVIAEEREWRRRFASWEPEASPTNGSEAAAPKPARAEGEFDRTDASDNPPDTTTIAGIYRALRKGREDSSNAPGAADFYYGEMEMRRLARREWHRRRNGTDAPRKPSLAEHWLLTLYWAVSGYGLRAWRAVAAIAVVILVGATVFATVGVDRSPKVAERASWVLPLSGEIAYQEVSDDPPAFTWWDGLELAGRSSLLFLRSTSSTHSLTGTGTIMDITLRLLVPVLFALAALAIRGRTKR
ncbi:pentapeptide repeat-containing protein [Rhodococcus ruber]